MYKLTTYFKDTSKLKKKTYYILNIIDIRLTTNCYDNQIPKLKASFRNANILQPFALDYFKMLPFLH